MALRVTLLSLCLSLISSHLAEGALKTVPDPARVQQLAAMLPREPRGVGRPITDRKSWEAVGKSRPFAGVVAAAEEMLHQPIPELADDIYLDFSRTGNRTRCEAVMGRRHARLPQLVLAECIENRGRFLPGIEEAIRELCREKTWVMPAHDRSLANFEGTTIEIDLQSSALSWGLATAAFWLGERLSPATRKLIGDELERRTLSPYTGAVTSGKPKLWWVTCTSNWNSVCQAGVTGAALAHIESPERRAFFLAAAEKNVRNFLDGITPDGYCTEGMGYWNYGFGNYVLLAETIKQATGGRVDLMEGAKVRNLALFGLGMEILPGTYPAFADCSPNSRPETSLMAFLSRRYGLGLAETERRGLLLASGSRYLPQLGLYGFENSATLTPAVSLPPPHRLRDWFSDAGILICRPVSAESRGLGAALKGGHNAEHHNHNDVGSFVVALAGGTPLLDPGAEVYTARTFSAQRYDSNVLNSFGHPVPRVAGTLQRPGRDAAAKILKSEFTDTTDTLQMDIRSAYPVKELTKLQRTFVFSREGAGSLQVIDEVEFQSPQEFGTALVTFSKWKQLAPNLLQVGEGPQAVEVRIDAGQKRVPHRADGDPRALARQGSSDAAGHRPGQANPKGQDHADDRAEVKPRHRRVGMLRW